MKALSLTFLLYLPLLIFAQTRLSRLQVTENKRYLQTVDGRPFFWLGDTGWEMLHKLDREATKFYLKKRASQGFNVIQTVALAELDGLKTPNANGDLPFIDIEGLQPNEKYFDHIEWALDRAAENGIYIALLPTWGDKLFKDRWGMGPEIFDTISAAKYGEWIGKRFRNKTNIIWVIGGDRNPRSDADVRVWRNMAEGIIKGVGDESKALMTFHPQPSASSSSSSWFHDHAWLDFNMLQTGHCRDIPVWQKIKSDYDLSPTKPTLNGEPIYEEHPVCFNAKELGHSTAYDVRKAAYLSVFAGSAGFTYGCHAVWQMYQPPAAGVNGPLRSWKESLTLPGASQMLHLRKLMESVGHKSLKPAQQMLIDTLQASLRIQAIAGTNQLLVYSAGGKTIRLKTARLNGSAFTSGYWFNPVTGATTMIKRSYLQRTIFEPPAGSDKENPDWLLVLQK